MMRLDCWGHSEAGGDGEVNEDALELDADGGVFVVSDGMGGRPGGQDASRAAVASFVSRIRALPVRERAEGAALRRVVARVNEDVLALAAADPRVEGLGCTLSAVVLAGHAGRVVHVGDSRIYRFRDGQLSQLTRDHTLASELIAAGRLGEDAARTHPLRAVLSRHLGAPRAEAEVTDVDVAAGAWLLLATDGFFRLVADCEIAGHLARGASVESVAAGLLALARERRPTDDMTLAVVRAEEAP